jgi:hypothetical protein
MMVELAGGDARISLEGDLSRCEFPDALVLSRDESGQLRRGTTKPRQDFVVLRLTPKSVAAIFEPAASAGITRAIIHVQIERAGILELGAYDHFACTVTGPGIRAELLEELTRKGQLRSFVVAPARRD